jgi:Ricin-type beta-trefoil lectin domain.
MALQIRVAWNQFFQIYFIDDTYFLIKTSLAYQQCLEVEGKSNNNEARIVTSYINYREFNPYQHWSAEWVSPGVYLIKNRGSGKYLDIPGSTHQSGAKLIQYDKHGGLNQRFGMFRIDNYFLVNIY